MQMPSWWISSSQIYMERPHELSATITAAKLKEVRTWIFLRRCIHCGKQWYSSVLSTWWADYIHGPRRHIGHWNSGSLVVLILWWTTGRVKVGCSSEMRGRHIDWQSEVGMWEISLSSVCLFVFTFSVREHISLWMRFPVNYSWFWKCCHCVIFRNAISNIIYDILVE